jgi:hypothetical protein
MQFIKEGDNFISSVGLELWCMTSYKNIGPIELSKPIIKINKNVEI